MKMIYFFIHNWARMAIIPYFLTTTQIIDDQVAGVTI